MKIRGHHGPSGRRVRERVTAAPLINSGGATRWQAARDTTSDTKYATCRYVTNGRRKYAFLVGKKYRFVEYKITYDV